MLKGKANQRELSATIPGHAELSIDLRAAGKKESVRNPMTMRMNETPFGAVARNPSAMKRNDAPQMIPGMATRSQSAVDACLGCVSSMRIRCASNLLEPISFGLPSLDFSTLELG